jgi:hypothetical protein
VSIQTIAIIGGTAWLAALTVTVLATVRQVAIVMVRLDRDAGPAVPVDDGLEVGSRVAEPVTRHIAPVPDRPSFVLVLAAVCQPCHELAGGLVDVDTSAPMVALVSGAEGSLADELAGRLPPSVRTVTREDAGAAVGALQVSTTPFVFEIRSGKVAAKAAVRGLDHLKDFISEAETVSTAELWPEPKVVTHAV